MSEPGAESRQREFEQEAEARSPGVVAEFLHFLRHSRKWWMLPILLLLVLLGLIVILAQTPAAPWIYSLF